MRKLSAEFIEQQNKGNRNYQKFVDITLKDGTVLNLTNKNLWNNGFSFEKSVSSPDNFEIGSAIIDKFTVVINNIYDEFSDYIFSGAKAVVYVGLKLSTGIEKIRICTGMVADEPKQRSSIITLQFHSYMEKFDKDYSEVKTVFPATRGQIVHDICSACDVTLQTVTFDRDDYLIQKRPSNDALTCRQMLAWVAQIGCQWAKCDEYGRLCLEWYNTNPTDEETIQIKSTSGAPSVNIEDVVITGVRVTEYLENSSEENPAKSYLYGKEGYVIAISGNKLVTEGTGETIAAMIGEKCVGMKFRPFSASCLTDIAMEAGDPVITTDRKGYAFFSYLTSVTLKPGDFEFVSCGAKSAERSSSKQYTIINQVESEAKNNIHREKTEREKALQDLADRIKESGGAFTTIQKDESGGSIFYLHNKPKLEDSDMVWKMTAEAWGVSTDGGKSWNAGMTVDGDTIVRILTATGVNADWINAGAITVKDSSRNIIFSVDMDTKKVVISGDSVQIGGKTASQALKDASDTANKALEEARKAHNLTVSLDNDFQGIPADHTGSVISPFPEVKTTVQVYYGNENVSEKCVYSITKSENVDGVWDSVKRTYTVTSLTAETGWVDIAATYLSIFTNTKRFNLVKNKSGEPGKSGTSVTVKSTEVTYQSGTSGTAKPTGTWSQSIPNVLPGQYLWTRTIVKYSDGKSTEAYSVSYKALNGEDGTAVNIVSTAVTYQISTSGTVVPTGAWGTGIPTVPSGQYLWTRTIVKYSDGNSTTSYSVSYKATDGKEGVAARTYFIEPSSNVLKRSKDNTIMPNFIEFKAYYRDGNSTKRTPYNGRFIIEETVDGNVWKTIYTSKSNENAVKHQVYSILTTMSGKPITAENGDTIGIPRDVTAVRCKLYEAGGTTNLMDMESVAVVVDVDNLTHAEIFDLFTENGTMKGIYKEGNQLYINATYIKSGTFVAGGTNNQNGAIEVRNGSNQVIGRWDKDGIYVEAGMIISKNEDSNSEVRVNGGRLNIFSKSKNIGFIGGNYQVNSGYYGLVFDLEVDGSFMTWSIKKSLNDNTYTPVLYYARKEGVLDAAEESVICGRNLDLLNYELKRANIRDAKISGSFKIPNNTQCDIYSDIDFHNWKLKNVKFEKIVGINGVLPYTGKFYATTATTPQYGATVFVKDGLITSVQKGFL